MRLRRLLPPGWVLFGALNAGLAVFLYFSLPAQPRWTTPLEAFEDVITVEPEHGLIFTRQADGLHAVDMITGRRLGLVVPCREFAFIRNEDDFSPDHRFYPVRFDKGKKVAVLDLHTLRSTVIDLHITDGSDSYRTPSLDFSPDSARLAIGVRDGHADRVLVVDPGTGQVLVETGPKTAFRSFLGGQPLMACRKDLSWEEYTITLWDVSTGGLFHESPPFLDHAAEDTRGYLYPDAWTPDGGTVMACRKSAAGADELVAWDVLRNRLRGEIPVKLSPGHVRTNIAPDGQTLLLTMPPDHDRLIFINLATGELRKEYPLPTPATYVSVSPDATLAVCGTEVNTLLFRLPAAELVEDTAEGRGEYWQFSDDSRRVHWLTFEGEMGHLLLAGEFTYHFRDLRTGAVSTCGPLLTDSCWPPEHQFAGQLLFVRSGVNQPPNIVLNFLREYLPLEAEPTNRIHCIDAATGRRLGRLAFPDTPRFRFAEPHQLLVTWHTGRNGPQLDCWAVPFRPAWSWVLGPPLVLLLLAPASHAWRFVRHRRRGAAPAGPAPTGS